LTKNEELMDIINRKRSSKKQNSQTSNESEELEVLGSESTRAPLITHADGDQDGSIVDELYKPRHKALMGEYAQKWDQDY
jgi:hypothetical protein